MQWLDKYTPLLFDEIDSTNEEALRIVRSKMQGNFLIWAKNQTKGKANPGKEWISKNGNLFVTVLQQKIISYTEAIHASFIISVAIGKALKKYSNDRLKIAYKWPNDILIDNRKVGNFILEASSSIIKNDSNYFIIGISINLNSYPDNLSFQATSLESEMRKEVDASDIILNLIEHIDFYQQAYKEKGFDYIRNLWIKKAAYLNQSISINIGCGYEEGKLLGIDESGSILLEQKNGIINKYSLEGIITHRSLINEI